MAYSKIWTQFETQALAFAILRKQLYPTYLVRGDQTGIRVYKPTLDTMNPVLELIVLVEASTSAEESSSQVLPPEDEGVPILKVRGGSTAYNVVALVKPLLK
jgi:hypothetical protein